MAELFVLRLTDNVENTVDFIHATDKTYRVADGGFDIGMPRVKRELAPVRQDFYVPVSTVYEYREAKLRFEVQGTNRSTAISSLNKIERTLRNIEARGRLGAGRRAELQYAWKDANQRTYFEVYGGTLAYPDDILSVAKVHMLSDGKYVIPEVELTLYISAVGYGCSIFATDGQLIPIPLQRYDGATKTPNPVAIYQTPGSNNFVTISKVDLAGSQPMITKWVLRSGTPYTNWENLYMGLQQEPYPTKLLYDSSETVDSKGTVTNAAWAQGGSYRTVTFSNSSYVDWFASFAWEFNNGSVGTFLAFLHAAESLPTNFQFSTGIDDYVTYGIRYKDEWVRPQGGAICPLGMIQLPPAGRELASYGTLHPDLWLGLWVAYDNSGGTMTLDFLSLLPVANGLRMLRSRRNTVTGMIVDDAWRGLEFVKNETNGQVWTPFYGLLEPLKLEPGVNQRVYFLSNGQAASTDERARQFTVQLFGVPTYSTLAL